MAWVPRDKLDAAVSALIDCANSLTTADNRSLRVMHPSQHIGPTQWENIICAMLMATSRQPDVVMPQGSYLIQEGFNAKVP